MVRKSLRPVDRTSLVEALSLVSAGLADSDLIPVLCHYWFKGDEIMAYNDQLAVSFPFETEFVGTVHGQSLYDILSKSSSSDVVLNPETEYLDLRVGKNAKFKLPSTNDDEFLFEMPEPEGDEHRLDVNLQELLDGIEICLQSLGSHVSQPERRGVTLIPTKQGKRKQLDLYSTDDKTISSAVVQATDLPFKDRRILPEPFCRELIKLGPDDIELIEVHDDYVLMLLKNGTRIFARLLEDPNPLDYESIFERYLPTDVQSNLIEVPRQIKLALERSNIIVQKSLEYKTYLSVTERSGKLKMKIHTTSDFGEVEDSFKLNQDHPEVTSRVDLKALMRAHKSIGIFDSIMIDKQVIVLAKGNGMFHMIANFA